MTTNRRHEIKIEEMFYYYVNYYLKDSFPEKSQKRIARFLKRTVYFFAILGPILTLPQIYKVWMTKAVIGFSMFTWTSYLFIAIFWLFFGVFTKNKPIILANFFWVLTHGFMVLSIITYR